MCVYDTTTYTTTTSVFGGTARRSVGAFKLEAAAPDRVISSTDHFSPRDDMAAAAAAAIVETLEEEVVVGGQVLERDGGGGGGGGGGRRRKSQGWKTMPFIIGTHSWICSPCLRPSPSLLLVWRKLQDSHSWPVATVELSRAGGTGARSGPAV